MPVSPRKVETKHRSQVPKMKERPLGAEMNKKLQPLQKAAGKAAALSLNNDLTINHGYKTERNYFPKEDKNFSFFLTNLANQTAFPKEQVNNLKIPQQQIIAEEANKTSRVTFKNNIDRTLSMSQQTFLNST